MTNPAAKIVRMICTPSPYANRRDHGAAITVRMASLREPDEIDPESTFPLR
jgi:hypothetical protein